jgi:hypothetical protein
MRTRFAVFVIEILHSAIKEEFHWPEFEMFNFRVDAKNYFSVPYFQIICVCIISTSVEF